MKMTGNTILITGGGSGIGLGLAEEFKKLGNEVIVAGRSLDKLAHAKSKGLQTIAVDMTRQSSIQELASEAIKKFPQLNVVIHNAGVMVNEKLTTHDTSDVALQTVQTNLLGPIFLTNALLPHLLKQRSATIMTVTSGLAYAPLMMTPTYCATKAAIHSYTESLRLQMKGTSIEVKELVPPYVATSLMGDRQAKDPFAMPLQDFINEVMMILKSKPEIEEITVERVLPQRTSAFQGAETYKTFLNSFNDRMLATRKEEWSKL